MEIRKEKNLDQFAPEKVSQPPLLKSFEGFDELPDDFLNVPIAEEIRIVEPELCFGKVSLNFDRIQKTAIQLGGIVHLVEVMASSKAGRHKWGFWSRVWVRGYNIEGKKILQEDFGQVDTRNLGPRSNAGCVIDSAIERARKLNTNQLKEKELEYENDKERKVIHTELH